MFFALFVVLRRMCRARERLTLLSHHPMISHHPMNSDRRSARLRGGGGGASKAKESDISDADAGESAAALSLKQQKSAKVLAAAKTAGRLAVNPPPAVTRTASSVQREMQVRHFCMISTRVRRDHTFSYSA